jgi:uncharacterized protein YcnI
MSRLLVRLGVVLAAAAALIASGGSLAVAHVSVHADDAVQGGAAEIAFQVPTESDTASTMSVKVALPMDTPIAGVAVLPLPGWTCQVTRTTLSTPLQAGHGEQVSEVVSQIEWRATGPDTAVKPGEYQVFRLAAGALPKTGQLVFKVVQTYDDGQVQRWIDEPVAGGSEPEHPAPVLALDGTVTAGHSHGAVTSVVPAASSQAATPAPAWWTAVIIALVALVAALASVVLAIRTTRRRGGDESPA